MRSRTFIITAAVLTLLFAAVGGIYFYDQSGRDTIPKGVKVAGVDVGGLTEAKATTKLTSEYVSRLQTPVKVYHGENTFVLTPGMSEVDTNVAAMVDGALAKVHDGNMFTRSFRRLTGGRLDADLEPETTYSKGNVVKFLDEIRGAINRDPIEAKVEFSAAGMKVQEARDGLEVKAHDLHMQIRKAVVDPEADHTLVAYTDHTPPKTTTSKIDKEYSTALVVDRSSFKLKLYKDFKLVKTYGIAVGMAGLETPAGLYHIQNKAVNPAWHVPNSAWAGSLAGQVIPGGAANNPIKARWMGIYDGAGIHGTSDDGSIGTNASHGCIRMHVWDVEELYEDVPVGAPIYIA